MPKLDESALTRGEMRKLNALRKSVGEDLGTEVFIKWLLQKKTQAPRPKTDPVAEKIAEAFASLDGPPLKLGLYGYTIKRARRTGGAEPVEAFVIYKNGKRAVPAN